MMALTDKRSFFLETRDRGSLNTIERCNDCGLFLLVGIDYPHRCEDRFPEYMRLDPSYGWSLTVGG